MKVKKANIHLDLIILSIVMLAVYLLPFASYTYQKTQYTLSGLDFILGKSICSGTIVFSANIFMVISLICIVSMLVLGFTKNRIKTSVTGGILFVISVIYIFCYLKLSTSVPNILGNAKNVHTQFGLVVIILLAVVVVARSLQLLKKAGKVSTLDFMVIPGVLYFVINNYIPMVGIAIAFKKIDYKVGLWDSPWVGFSNFKMLFSFSGSFFASDAWIITRNTLLYNFAFIFFGLLTGLIAGLCLHDIASKKLQKTYQTSILLPQLISMVIVAYVVYGFLNNETGMVNKMLGENSVNFYSEKKYWPFILVFINVWKQIGYNAIIFLSSLVGIDRSIFEAGRVDGASKWQTIRYITLPMLKPTIVTLILLQVSRIMYSDFGLFYQVPMNSGALYSVTNTIDTYVYRCLMVLNNISTASAASAYQAIVGFALILVINLVMRKADKENALF